MRSSKAKRRQLPKGTREADALVVTGKKDKGAPVGDLANKVALVTGGGQGIGRGIAIELARAGADIVVAQRHLQFAEAVASEIAAIGRKGIALPVDVCDESSVSECIKAALVEFPRIDILVNNAGVAQEKFYAETELATFDACYAVNLRGVWCVASCLIPHFRRYRSGKIINVASINGRLGDPQLPAYSASKAALISLTQSLAGILGPDNVNVNAVCPGPIWTAQQENHRRLAMQRGEIDETHLNSQEFYKAFVDKIALRRVATPQDVGFAVAFLASESARGITGQALNIDCGMVMN
jgi:meso-butanediol dehydrogenase/(S,S)-butanediol dehydrogenase/diacetyl reductase